jgi:hypothetical protein
VIKRQYRLEGRVDVSWNDKGATAAITFPADGETVVITMTADALKSLQGDIGYALAYKRPWLARLFR